MATGHYLFESPPSHLEVPDRSYRRALLDPEAGPLLEALAWEDASADHAEGETSAADAARDWWEKTLRAGYAARLGVPSGADIHHAIELQVLDKFPGAFSPRELNSFRNMRGIPLEVTLADLARRPDAIFADLARRGIQRNSPEWAAAVRSWRRQLHKNRKDTDRPKQMHGSYIRKWWNQKYNALKDAIKADPRLVQGTDPWRRLVRRELMNARKELDWRLKGRFTEQGKGLDWSRTGQHAREERKSYVDPKTGIAYRRR